jgi:diadenylate cyclase
MEWWESLREVLSSRTLFSVVLDVLLMSFIFYRILLLVRGTRGLLMLLGLAILGVFYVISRELGLITVNWLLGNFLGSVILVIVVLFQDDLRRGLIKVGLMPGFGASLPQEVELSLKEIARTATELASRRIGALIVIRRDVGLEDYIERAVLVDAVVSRELLVSIFSKSSPLHDGAVIVEQNRVVAAGAVLPLTFNPSISSSYGTRHRAALGVSEHTDAVVVVVSEETGAISAVREGRITSDFDEKTLYNALFRLTVLRHRRRDQQLSALWSLIRRKRSEPQDAAVDKV